MDKIGDMINWESPSYALSALIGVNLLYFIMFVLNHSLISVMSWACFCTILLCCPLGLLAAPANAAQQPNTTASSGDKKDTNSTERDEIIPKEVVEGWTWYLYDQINEYAVMFRRLLLWKNPTISLLALAGFAFLAHTAAAFKLSVASFLYFSVHTMFLYTFIKNFHEEFLALLKDKTIEIFNKIPRFHHIKQH